MQYTSKSVYEYISKKTNDPIVEWKTCRVSGTQFPIYQSDLDFYDKITPTFDGKRFQIPTPTLCPEERLRKRLVRRNDRKLYKRTCDSTGKDIITIYSPEYSGKVFSSEAWRSDSWSGFDYGKEYNPSETFMSQFGTLLYDVPHLSLYTLNNEDSPFTHGVTALKKCYLCFNCDGGENNYYLSLSNNCTDCVDSDLLYECDNCFQSINCKNCRGCIGCVDCEQCADCIGCVGLSNKQYHINNKSYSKEEYQTIKTQIRDPFYLGSEDNSTVREQFHGTSNDRVYGDYVHHSSMSSFVYESSNLENCKHCLYVFDSKDCQDFTVYGDGCSLVYNAAMVGPNGYNIVGSAAIWSGSNNIYYSFLLVNCSDCFGCVGLKNAQYCVFNKQYSKEEYEMLVSKIIVQMQSEGERGDFLSQSISPWGYNESMSDSYMNTTKEVALGLGYTWSELDAPINLPSGASTLSSKELNDDEWFALRDDDDVVNKIIICETSGKPFRIIKQELDFYRKHNLLLPKKHPDIRHQERLKKRPGRTLYLRACDKTGEQIVSVYPENCGFPVYNEESYKKEIYK